MTSIREMDEFFDFEEAGITGATVIDGRMHFSNGTQQHSACGAYDIDLILAEAANDEFSFNKYPQFEGDFLQPSGFSSVPMDDTTMGYAQDFNDYSPWINGAVRPDKSCSHCRHNQLQCTVLRNIGLGSNVACTSCVALSQQCSFTYGAVHDPQLMGSPTSSFQQQTDFEMVDAMPTQGQTPRSGGSKSPSFRESSHENSEGSNKLSGARFSRDTVRLLRNWLQVHHSHPYPTEEEKEDLKRRTGLTKVQITNWLANARRRGQVKPPRTSSPSPYNRARPMIIPNQTAKSFENIPLERWKNSPPEHEPASVAAIAKAVDSSPTRVSTQTSPDSYPRSEGSVHSVARASSASSRSTTHSSVNSIGSVASHHSRGSFGSFGKRGRRRRRHTAKPVPSVTTGPTRQYQCTFCTESFKTKHDWQRHEKSLHLSLERWVCAPSKNKNAVNMKKCVFCGIQNPSDKHYETHNHATCSERPLEERTFYRKDHLRQHLRLVHDCQFLASTMDAWKIAAPEVRSRCGFCGLVMDTWPARVDHLAEHFKAGRTMEEWKGGWGFESSVMKLVENGMPPYLIHSRRMAALSTSDSSPFGQPAMTPYDSMKAGLLNFANKQAALGLEISDDDLRAEACRSLIASSGGAEPLTRDIMASWFKEMIMCPDDTLWLEDVKRKAGLLEDANLSQNQKSDCTAEAAGIDIDDREAVEKYCELERRLADFVNSQKALGVTPTDNELKAAGCRMVLEYDRMYSVVHSATAATWFCDQIMCSNSWLKNFRVRLGLPLSSQMDNVDNGSDENAADRSIHTSLRLEQELAEFVKTQLAVGVIPSDSDLQRQARLIIYEVDDGFFQTLADDGTWLTRFKHAHGVSAFPSATTAVSSSTSSPHPIQPTQAFSSQASSRPLYTLQDAKCYRRLELELSRFVASCMSPHAPNPHIPSDDEIRRQARWVLYNDDNPWNQTAVDNAEWLLRFKRSNGLAPLDGTAMPTRFADIDMHFGGIGLTPPSTSDDDLVPLAPLHSPSAQAAIDAGTRAMNTKLNFGNPEAKATPVADCGCNLHGNNRNEKSHDHAKHAPAAPAYPRANPLRASIPKVAISTVFCSWDLEAGLARFAASRGGVVSDEDLKSKAREITGKEVTPADDAVLLVKFKQVYGLGAANRNAMRGSKHDGSRSSQRGGIAKTQEEMRMPNRANVVWREGERGLRGSSRGNGNAREPKGYEGRIDPALLAGGGFGDVVMQG